VWPSLARTGWHLILKWWHSDKSKREVEANTAAPAREDEDRRLVRVKIEAGLKRVAPCPGEVGPVSGLQGLLPTYVEQNSNANKIDFQWAECAHVFQGAWLHLTSCTWAPRGGLWLELIERQGALQKTADQRPAAWEELRKQGTAREHEPVGHDSFLMTTCHQPWTACGLWHDWSREWSQTHVFPLFLESQVCSLGMWGDFPNHSVPGGTETGSCHLLSSSHTGLSKMVLEAEDIPDSEMIG
jgi:hypothetical protein